jgi:hypothetical protein
MSYRTRLGFGPTCLCLGMIALHGAVFWLARSQVLGGLPDFKIFYTAGLILRRGEGSMLYSNDLQLKTQREFVREAMEGDSPLPYNHPPFEALLFVGTTFLPYLRAYSLWFLMNLAMVVATVRLMRPWVPTFASTFPRLLFLAPFAYFPVAYALMQGQDSILLTTLYCLAYVALRRGQGLRAGLFLGAGLFKFHLVLPFAFILLLRRQWRAVAGILLSACCELGFSWLLVGWKELLYYPRYAWQVNRHQAIRVIVPNNMANLRGLFTGWSWAEAIRPWPELALLTVSVCLLVWASRRLRPGDLGDLNSWNTGFSIAMVATFLVGYHGYNQDLSILLVPIFIMFDRMLQGRPAVSIPLKVTSGLMFLSPLYVLLTIRYGHQNLFALVLIGFLVGLAESSVTAIQSASVDTSPAPSSARPQ